MPSTTPAGTISQMARGVFSLAMKSASECRAVRALAFHLGHARVVHVEHHAFMPAFHEPPHHVGAHPSQADHS